MTTKASKQTFQKGEIILKQGDIGTNAYIIEEGRVEIIHTHDDGRSYLVATRGPGTLIGEMAVIDAEPRSATVKAIEDCKLLEISKDDFNRRLNGADPVVQTVTQVLLARYRDILARATLSDDPLRHATLEDVERSFLRRSNAAEDIKIANDLKDALNQKDQLYLVFQPIVDFQTGDVAGFEALIRWDHPEKGFIPPSDFIPIAEDTGLIVDVSQWVMEQAGLALGRIQDQLPSDHPDNKKLYMAINFSSLDFAEGDFLASLYKVTDQAGISAEQLHLEITERLLITHPKISKSMLETCRKAGFTIVIDDFGTGYSSLSYLHYYPIDKLKIDQSFVTGMKEDETAAKLFESIIMLAKNINITTVTEGIETKEDAIKIKALNCDEAQGYYFAKPMMENDIIALLKTWNSASLFS